jgi:phosphate transport system substrate-binding protein
MSDWAEAFARLHHLDMTLQAKGSRTAFPALIDGSSQLGPMSRLPKTQELLAFSKAHPNRTVLVLPVAIDLLAVAVHPDNPIDHLSVEQLAGMFAVPTDADDPLKPITQWSQAGWDDGGPVILIMHGAVTGSYGFFKKQVMARRAYRNDIRDQVGRSAFFALASTPGGIAYSHYGYLTPSVKPIALIPAGAELAVLPEDLARYPLRRLLYLVVTADEDGHLLPAVTEFMSYVYSQEGQQVVLRNGFVPLPESLAEACRAMIHSKRSTSE